MKAISLRLDEQTLQDIKKVSSIYNIPTSDLIRKGIKMILEAKKSEAYYRLTADIEETTQKETDEIIERLNKYNDAIIDYKKSIALMPEFIAPYKSLLSIYLQTQNYEAGLEVADKAINIEQSWILYSTRGYLFLMLQSYNEAISDSNRAIKLNSGFADSYLTRGKAYLALKEYKKAIEDFDRAIELDPDNIDKVKQEAIEYKKQAYEALTEMEGKK